MGEKMLKNREGKCLLCGCDISEKKITALYCDKCRKIVSRRAAREDMRKKRKYYEPKVCKNCKREIERTSELKYWSGYCERCK